MIRDQPVVSELSKDLASLRIERHAPPRSASWRRPVLLVGVLAALGGAAALVVPRVAASVFKPEVKLTEVLAISPAQASVSVTSTGYVVPQSNAKVGSNVIGRIVKVLCVEGQTVKAGDVLFELDQVQQRAAIASAQARAASAQARARAAEALSAESRVPYEREKKLVARGASASSVVDDLAAKLNTLDAQAKAAFAEAAAAQAEVRALQATAGHYTITAPLEGVVQTKPAQVGDVAFPEKTLLELVEPSSMLVETDVPESRIHQIESGQPAEIVLDSAPQKRWRGAVVDISPRINRAKATATVKVRFVDAPDRLSPDMAARVSFLSKALDRAEMAAPPRIVVPKAAVIDAPGGGKALYVLAEGRLHLTPITLGPEEQGNLVLESGPPPGTRVVAAPSAQLHDGQAVKESP